MGIIHIKSVKCTSNHKNRKTRSYLLQRARKCYDSSFVVFALFTFLTVNACDALELVRPGAVSAITKNCCVRKAVWPVTPFLFSVHYSIPEPTWSPWTRSFTACPQREEIKLMLKWAVYGDSREFLRDLRKSRNKINNPPASLAVADILHEI